MFESNDISTQWDGSYKGNLCEAGVFYWMIQCRSLGANNDKKFIERWGSVSIIR